MDQLVGYVGVLNASNPSLQEDLSSTAKLTIYWLAIINMGRGVGGGLQRVFCGLLIFLECKDRQMNNWPEGAYILGGGAANETHSYKEYSMWHDKRYVQSDSLFFLDTFKTMAIFLSLLFKAFHFGLCCKNQRI